MGFLDFLGGSSPEKAMKLKAKVTQKYGDPASRQKAIQQLEKMDFPEATAALLARFTINVEPQTTDLDEKEHVFELVRGKGEKAVGPVLDFLKRSDSASSWALRLLTELVPEETLVGIISDYLIHLGTQYMRNPEKKIVLLQFVAERDDPRIAPVLTPFLDDMSDDVKIATLRALGSKKHEEAREPMLKVLTAPETAKRVQTSAIVALSDSGFGVQGFREKVEALLSEPYFVDKSGVIKKRGAAEA